MDEILLNRKIGTVLDAAEQSVCEGEAAPVIKRLDESYVDDIIALRRETLLTEPAAFLSSPDSDAGQDPTVVRDGLRRPTIQATFGAFDPDLVGMVGVQRFRRPKEAHKAGVHGMYVRPAHRGKGLGGDLLTTAVEFARSLPGVTHLYLAVTESQAEAMRLYQRMGFVRWGTEPAAMQLAGMVLEVHHMVLRLDEGDGEGSGTREVG